MPSARRRHCVIADPLEAPGDEDHAEAPLAALDIVADLEEPVLRHVGSHGRSARRLEQRFGREPVPFLQRAEGDPDHLLRSFAHLPETFEQDLVGGSPFVSFVNFAIVTQRSPSA